MQDPPFAVYLFASTLWEGMVAKETFLKKHYASLLRIAEHRYGGEDTRPTSAVLLIFAALAYSPR